MNNKLLAAEYLRLNDMWVKTDADIISRNTLKFIDDAFSECRTNSDKQEKLMQLTNSSKHTVYAWMNKSRENVKIPLIKLCMVAEALNIDVYEFLKEREMN